MKKLILYGPGGLGQQTAYLIQTYYSKKYQLLGFVADQLSEGTKVYRDLKVIGSFQEVIKRKGFRPKEVAILVTIGYLRMAEREKIFNIVLKAGYEIPNIINPSAIIEKDVELGKGIVIDAGVIIDKHSKVKDCVYLNPGTCISHNCEIGQGSILAPEVTIGGNVLVGQYTFIGIGSTVINDIKIGDFSFINAATLVTKDIPNYSKYREIRISKILKRNDLKNDKRNLKKRRNQ